MDKKLEMYSKNDIDFIVKSFGDGMRLAYVHEIDQLVSDNKLSLRACFTRIGRPGSVSRFSQWKKHGVPKRDRMLRAILKLDLVPQIKPSLELMFHWGYRLSVVQTNHAVVLGHSNLKSCRPPLDLTEFIYLSVAYDIATSHREPLNLALAEHVEVAHSRLPAALLQLVPHGQDIAWFSALVGEFHEALQAVRNVVGQKSDSELGDLNEL